MEKKIIISIETLQKELGRLPLPEEVCTDIGMALDKFEMKYSFFYKLLTPQITLTALSPVRKEVNN